MHWAMIGWELGRLWSMAGISLVMKSAAFVFCKWIVIATLKATAMRCCHVRLLRCACTQCRTLVPTSTKSQAFAQSEHIWEWSVFYGYSSFLRTATGSVHFYMDNYLRLPYYEYACIRGPSTTSNICVYCSRAQRLNENCAHWFAPTDRGWNHTYSQYVHI